MKRKALAILVPALLIAGTANAAEIYNKNSNKVDFYGKRLVNASGAAPTKTTAKTKIPLMPASV